MDGPGGVGEVDVGPARGVEDRPDPVGVLEGEAAGGASAAGGARGTTSARARAGHGRPLVVVAGLPAHEGQAATGPDRGAQVGEGGHGIGEEHDAEAADQDVGGSGAQVAAGGVGLPELDVVDAALGGPDPGHVELVGREVDAEHRPVGLDGPRGRHRQVTAAAADVEHPFTRCERGAFDTVGAKSASRALNQSACSAQNRPFSPAHSEPASVRHRSRRKRSTSSTRSLPSPWRACSSKTRSSSAT